MARTLLLSGGICLASFIGVGITAEPSEERKGAIAIGERTVITVDTDYVCLQGHHRVANAAVTLKLDDGTEFDCETISISDKPWDDEISTTTWSYRGKEVVETGHKDLTLKLRVSIPDMPSLAGQEAKLVASGDVIYPYAPKGGNTFEDRAREFSSLKRVSLMTPEDVEAAAEQPAIAIGLTLLFMLSGLMFLGTIVVRFFRSPVRR